MDTSNGPPAQPDAASAVRPPREASIPPEQKRRFAVQAPGEVSGVNGAGSHPGGHGGAGAPPQANGAVVNAKREFSIAPVAAPAAAGSQDRLAAGAGQGASRQGGGLSRNNSNSNVADMAVSRPTQSDGAHTQCGRPESVIREAVALVTHGDAHDQAASSDAYALLSVAASAPPAPAPAQSIQSSSPAGGIQGGIHAGRLRAGGGDGTSIDEWSVSQELARLRAAAAGARAAAEAYEPRAGPYPAPRPYMPSLVNSHAERLQHPFPVSVMPRVETSSSRCASR